RRQALVAIAALPYGALAAAKLAGTEIAPEAFLPQATAAITSCWSIMQHREFTIIKQALAHCLPALTTLAQKSSPHQQVAASLVAQSNLLLGLVSLHSQPAPQSSRQWLFFSKQAMELTALLDDPTLRILSLCHLGYAEGDLDHISTMLEALEEAKRLSDHELVSPTLRRKVYIEFAYAYARAEQAQQALRYQSALKTDVAQVSEEVPVYLQDSGLFHEGLLESQLFEMLGRREKNSPYYQRAWNAIEEIGLPSSPLLVPERFRLEAINQKALVAVRLGDLEQFMDLSLQGIQRAKALQSEKRRQEIIANWKEARKIWPREPHILELADALVE
ncbi:MAG TPA: hypothetical protein VFV38_00525, partial [Ktedonobacteraceae bacterium]|nr:hypothetical protein [Ktedonobacteraceae bacterium]